MGGTGYVRRTEAFAREIRKTIRKTQEKTNESESERGRHVIWRQG